MLVDPARPALATAVLDWFDGAITLR